ncbi:hypothetical protein Pth03_62640 [Planotetraspora thailandica]|uniref:Uncharacterized protein n=1 Tax=Planotetraspora thailandica TaxID=487172 RepID=A0A8J3XYT3_9ACTN|nr:hypothetical protein Pth03_62640 [Planotetraspora thailandica]
MVMAAWVDMNVSRIFFSPLGRLSGGRVQQRADPPDNPITGLRTAFAQHKRGFHKTVDRERERAQTGACRAKRAEGRE